MNTFLVPSQEVKEWFESIHSHPADTIVDPERISMFNQIKEQRSKNVISLGEALKAMFKHDCYMLQLVHPHEIYHLPTLESCLAILDKICGDPEAREELEVELKKKLDHVET